MKHADNVTSGAGQLEAKRKHRVSVNGKMICRVPGEKHDRANVF
jgi:hypothetical protein